MVESGQLDIRAIEFAGAADGLPVEMIQRSDLSRRFGPEFFARPDRPSFDTFMLIERGNGFHTIDFERIQLLPRRIVRTRPGQVQSWEFGGEVEATMLLSRAEPLSPALTERRPAADLGAESWATALALTESIRREQERFDGSAESSHLLTTLLRGVEALFDRAQVTDSSATVPEPYLAFRRAIEQDLGSGHKVRDHARLLGYSERTLTRACQRVTGMTAKGVLDQRLTLEAKRLLAHSDTSAAAIGVQLGFTEATNFGKFFLRNTGQRPAQFRAGLHRTLQDVAMT